MQSTGSGCREKQLAGARRILFMWQPSRASPMGYSLVLLSVVSGIEVLDNMEGQPVLQRCSWSIFVSI